MPLRASGCPGTGPPRQRYWGDVSATSTDSHLIRLITPWPQRGELKRHPLRADQWIRPSQSPIARSRALAASGSGPGSGGTSPQRELWDT